MPKIRSPSQWPGTARSATSAGPLRDHDHVAELALADCPWCRPWPVAWPDRCAGTNGALCAALHDSGRTVTGRWSRGTPASPGDRGTAKPITPRSARATTWPRACARPPLEAAGTERAWPAWVAAPADTPHGVATRARYFLRPPLAFTSRHTVEGDRPRAPAMARMESPAARPREISSRSSRDSRSPERCRAVGRFPPASAMNLRHVLPAQMLGDALYGYSRLTHVPDRLALFLAKASPHLHTS